MKTDIKEIQKEANAMLLAFRQLGIGTGNWGLTDEQCCELLVWLLVFGGGYEATTQDSKLTNDIVFAQQRLNLFGGETPNGELVLLYKTKFEEVKHIHEKSPKEQKVPKWVIAIFQRYGIKVPEKLKSYDDSIDEPER